LLLFDVDLFVKILNSLCHVLSLLLHFHDHVLLHGDFFVGLALLPEIEGIPLGHLPSTYDHSLQVLVQHHALPLLDIFPLVEVLGHLSIDHAFDGVEASLTTRPYGLLRLHLNLFVERFDGGLTIAFKCLAHEDEFLLLLALSESIEASLEKGAIAIFLEAKDRHVGREHVLPVLIRLLPGFDIGAQPVQSLSPHFKQGEPHLVKCDPQHLLLCESSCEHVKTHLVVHGVAVGDPLLPSLSQLVGVCSPNHPF